MSVDPTSLPKDLASPQWGDSSPAIKTVFTNSRGRFSVQGLSPGEWQLRLHGKYDHLRFVLTVPEGTVGLLRADALRPVEE